MPRQAGVVGVGTVLGPLISHGSTWGAEWDLKAAIRGHLQFPPCFISEENTLDRGDSFLVS